MSGLGGIQSGPNMLTELQQAHKPNLNALARKSINGLIHVVAPGIIPGPGVGIYRLLGCKGGSEKKNQISLQECYGIKTCLITDNSAHAKICSSLALDFYQYPSEISAGISKLSDVYANYDFLLFFSSHIERPARMREYYEKVKAIEEFDLHVVNLINFKSDVLAISGDCSIPTTTGTVSWHPVPILIYSHHCRYDYVQSFDEIACSHGGLGFLSSEVLMPLLMAHAGRSLPVSY